MGRTPSSSSGPPTTGPSTPLSSPSLGSPSTASGIRSQLSRALAKSPPSLTSRMSSSGGGGTDDKASTAGLDGVSPTELLFNLPPPLLRLVILAAPYLQSLATMTLILGWRHPKSPWASWLVVFLWWGATLQGELLVKLGGLNWLVVGWLWLGWARDLRRRRKQRKGGSAPKGGTSATPQPETVKASPTTLVHTLADAQILADALSDLIPTVNPVINLFNWSDRYLSRDVLLIAITSLPFSLALFNLVEIRYTLCAVGTVALTWRAPWLIVLRGLLWRSRLIRGTIRLTIALMLRFGAGFSKEWQRGQGKEIGLIETIFGSGTEPPRPTSATSREAFKDAALRSKDSSADDGVRETVETKGGEIEFSFHIFENQRWWVGLDWTAALLPSERAPWSDASQHAVAPPSSFVLPPPTVSYRPDPKNRTKRLRRTVEWKWIDPEWEVRKASPPVSNFHVSVSPIATAKRRASSSSTTAAAAGKGQASGGEGHKGDAAGRQAAVEEEVQQALALGIGGEAAGSEHGGDDDAALHAEQVLGLVHVEEEDDKGWDVDAQGWQYGDNHWERLTSKGGLGKYTRRRAWIRRAIIIEMVDRVPLEDVPAPVADSLAYGRYRTVPGLGDSLAGIIRADSPERIAAKVDAKEEGGLEKRKSFKPSDDDGD